MVACHYFPDADLDSDSAVAMPLDHGSGFNGSRIDEIRELPCERSMQAHKGNMHEAEQVSAAVVYHRPPELGEVGKACGACVHGRGHAVIEADLGVYAEQPG